MLTGHALFAMKRALPLSFIARFSVMTGVIIRAETPEGIPAITALINVAFTNVTHSDLREAQTINRLREDGALR